MQKQQQELKDRLEEFDDECGGGSRKQQKDIDHAREVAERARPTKEQWDGPVWAPEPAPEPSGLTTNQKLLIVGGGLLVLGGVLGSFFTGGGSLAVAAAGVAIIAGASASGSPQAGANSA
jgi:hypothetical protein